jgi:hypothetical protein
MPEPPFWVLVLAIIAITDFSSFVLTANTVLRYTVPHCVTS